MKDIKAEITRMAESVLKDEKLREQFGREPVKAVEKILGVDLPDEIVEQIITGVKAKIAAEQASGALNALKKLF